MLLHYYSTNNAVTTYAIFWLWSWMGDHLGIALCWLSNLELMWVYICCSVSFPCSHRGFFSWFSGFPPSVKLHVIRGQTWVVWRLPKAHSICQYAFDSATLIWVVNVIQPLAASKDDSPFSCSQDMHLNLFPFLGKKLLTSIRHYMKLVKFTSIYMYAVFNAWQLDLGSAWKENFSCQNFS